MNWIPAAESDMNLLVWANQYIYPRAMDTAPSVVGPGHDGGCSMEATVPHWIRKTKEFSVALLVRKYLQKQPLQEDCGAVVRDTRCEHCNAVEPWLDYQANWQPREPVYRHSHGYRGNPILVEVKSYDPKVIRAQKSVNFAQVVWFAYGLHGAGTKLPIIETHLGWQYGSEVQRSRWAKLSSRSVRAESMAVFGRWLLAQAVTVYEDLNKFKRIYRETVGYIRTCQ